MGFGLALILGFVPALLCAFLLYWADRYEKEPRRLLGGVFLWGAFVATAAAGVAQVKLQRIVEVLSGSAAVADFAGASLFAPTTEELLKAVAVYLVFAVLRDEFDSVLDGVVYAGVVALGFAATENALYLYSGYLADGGDGLLQLFVVRVVLGIWNHPLYTSFFGIGLALSRLARRRAIRVTAPILGIAASIMAHSVHNTLVGLNDGRFLVLALLLDWGGWAFLAAVVVLAARSEGRLVAGELAEEECVGLLSKQQLRTASSSLRRSAALLRSLGRSRFGATRSFYQACADLAHKKRQLRTVGEETDSIRRIENLRRRVKALAPRAAH